MSLRVIKLLLAAACLTGAAAVNASSQTRTPCDSLQPSRKVDEYVGDSPPDELARLEKFIGVVKGEPEDARGFIVAYAGRGARAGDALARAERAKDLLVEKSVSHNERLNAIDCGYREEPATELWITPVGAAPPVCSPTVEPPEARVKNPVARRRARPRPASRKNPGR